MIVDKKIGVGIFGIYSSDKVNAVFVKVVCEQSTSIVKGKSSIKIGNKIDDGASTSRIKESIFALRASTDSNVFIGDDLKLSVYALVEQGAYITVSSSHSLAVEMVDPSADIRQIIENKGVEI